MRKVAFWRDCDLVPQLPRLEDVSMILDVPEDQDDPKQWAIDNGHINLFECWVCADITYEVTKIKNLLARGVR